MEARITQRSAKRYTIEIEIPDEFSSMLAAETVIQAQVNKVGTLATGEALKQFETEGPPVFVDGQKLTSKGQIAKTYQTPYGDVTIDRHVYQSSQGGGGAIARLSFGRASSRRRRPNTRKWWRRNMPTAVGCVSNTICRRIVAGPSPFPYPTDW